MTYCRMLSFGMADQVALRLQGVLLEVTKHRSTLLRPTEC